MGVKDGLGRANALYGVIYMLKDEAARHGLTVDKIMEATDSPLFFGWKDLKPLLNKKGYYNGIKRNKPLLFLTSKRRIGKSTTVARWFIASYVCEGARFLYIRRSDDLLYSTMHKFFDQAIKLINRAFKDVFEIVLFNCETKEGQLTYTICINWAGENYEPIKYDKNGDVVDLTDDQKEDARKKDLKERSEGCGSALSLRAYEKAKSAGYDGRNIMHFVYDEFMAEQETDYLGSKDNKDVEWDDLQSIYMSVDSDIDNPFLNKVTVLCLGNNAHKYNPILLRSGVNIYLAQSPDAICISPKTEAWTYYQIEGSDAFKKLQQESNAFWMMQHDDRLKGFIFDNKHKDNDQATITSLIASDIPKGCEFYNTIILGGKYYGVFYRAQDGCVYISSTKHDLRKGRTEALDMQSYCNGNAVMIVRKWRQSPTLNLIYERFICKKVLFSDKNTQYKFLQYLEFIPS